MEVQHLTAPPELASLCDHWKQVVQQRSSPKHGGEFSFQPDDCELCILLSSFVPKIFNGYSCSKITTWPNEVVTVTAQNEDCLESIWLFCDNDVPCPWGIFSRRPYTKKTIKFGPDTDLLDKVTTLISHCLSNHQCGDGQMDLPLLPTRVLEVEPNSNQVRLVQSNKIRAQYVCLSHCWGSEQPLITTKGNLASHLKSILWSTIPKCYQETFQVAQKLGINYVWIDSLCIIQDDHDDWVQQSQNMCDIYEKAYLTVCATSSPDCTTGMWNLTLDSHLQFHGTNGAGQPYLFVASLSSSGHLTSMTGARERVKDWPLLDRAWAYQERMLAPRVLHFSRRELIWECQEETFCECGYMRPYGKDKRYHETLRNHGGDQLGTVWREVVRFYSNLSLTFPSDKLPALSGLARRFQKLQPGIEYLAGLWEKSLIEDLMWMTPHVIYKKLEHKSLSLWRAPSWSWVVTNNGVVFSTGSFFLRSKTTASLLTTHITIISANCTLATMDPTGQVKSGSLQIMGRIILASISKSQDSILALNVEGSSLIFHMTYPTSRKLYLDANDDLSECLPHWPQDSRVMCLPLARVRRHYSDGLEDEEENCLVLVPTHSRPKEYRRIGFASLCSGEGKPEDVAKFWRENPSWWEGGKLDTITIV